MTFMQSEYLESFSIDKELEANSCCALKFVRDEMWAEMVKKTNYRAFS